MNTEMSSEWSLYLLECENGYLYAGISTNVERRFLQHQSGKGAKFTRINMPVRILGQKSFSGRSEASVAEVALKRLSRQQKLDWAADNPG